VEGNGMTAHARATATVALACLAIAAPASAAKDRFDPLADTIADHAVALQRADGKFPDYIAKVRPGGRDAYGPAVMGYGLLQSGLRRGERRVTEAGLRAVTYAAQHRINRQIFADMAIAGAYDLAQRKLSGDPDYLAVQSIWERHLRREKFTLLGVSDRYYYNWYLVEAVAVLELVHSGLKGGVSGSVLSNPPRARRLVGRLLERVLPTATDAYSSTDGEHVPVAIVSDPPYNPLAYHAFSSGLLARAIDLLGNHASPRLRWRLHRMVRASWAFAAPDGDVSYIGRSQEQSWTLAFTAAAARTAADFADTTSRRAQAEDALARRVLQRYRGRYAGGPFGYAITPALAGGLDGAVDGLDPYAAAVSYSGLSLVGLEWALSHERPEATTAGAIGADSSGASGFSSGSSSFAAVRRGPVWFAVRQASPPDGSYAEDLRYWPGLMALKARDTTTGWRDVVPVRPITGTRDAAVGPQLVAAGTRAAFQGTALNATRDGEVIVHGGYRTAGGRWLGHGLVMRFTPTPCGVRATFPTRPGKRYVFTTYLRGSGVTRTPGQLADGAQRIMFDRGSRVTLHAGYHSGADARLTRAHIAFAPATGDTLTVEFCDPRLPAG
jgi:hypothetical protein